MPKIAPFTIEVPATQVTDLRRRLRATAWPAGYVSRGWERGPAAPFVRACCRRLLDGYDWRATETRLNQYDQYVTRIEGQRIHFLHLQSRAKASLPLLLLHGWPGSFVEFTPVINALTQPADDQLGFELIIPSLPGHGFSGPIDHAGWDDRRIAAALLALLERLGLERFGVHGSDMGALIGPEIGRQAPDRVVGIHVNAASVGFIPLGPVPEEVAASLRPAERQRLSRLQRYLTEQSGYNTIQSHRPDALSYALADSPVGLLAWMSELFTGFGEKPAAVDRDLFLTNFLVRWFSGTGASSIRHYYENAHAASAQKALGNSGVPTAVAVFEEGDVAIRRFSEESNTIVRWTEYAKGGHYAVMETPEIWCRDVREFFSSLRADPATGDDRKRKGGDSV